MLIEFWVLVEELV